MDEPDTTVDSKGGKSASIRLEDIVDESFTTLAICLAMKPIFDVMSDNCDFITPVESANVAIVDRNSIICVFRSNTLRTSVQISVCASGIVGIRFNSPP